MGTAGASSIDGEARECESVVVRFGFRLGAVLAASAAVFAIGGVAVARRHASGPALRQIGRVTLPSPYVQPSNFDISQVDPQTQTYYLSDRDNKGIDVIDARSDSFEAVIGAGTLAGTGSGASASQLSACGGSHGVRGPNGNLVLRVGGVSQLWVGDGVTAGSPASSVKVFDLGNPRSGTLAATIPTGGVCRANDLSYDRRDGLVLVGNDHDSPPFVSFISVRPDPSKDKVLGTIKFPDVIDGLQGVVWDQHDHVFYQNVPQVPTRNRSWLGEVAVISPRTMSVTRTFRLPGCSPGANPAFDLNARQLLVGCSSDAIGGDTVRGVTYRPSPLRTYVLSVPSGRIVADVHQVGGSDQVWFDPGSNRYYVAADSMTSNGTATGYPTPVLGVISAPDDRWIENVPTAISAHVVAVDPANGHVFVPIPGYGIAVFRGAPKR